MTFKEESLTFFSAKIFEFFREIPRSPTLGALAKRLGFDILVSISRSPTPKLLLPHGGPGSSPRLGFDVLTPFSRSLNLGSLAGRLGFDVLVPFSRSLNLWLLSGRLGFDVLAPFPRSPTFGPLAGRLGFELLAPPCHL